MKKGLSSQEQRKQEKLKPHREEEEEQRRRKREELKITLPEPLKPWATQKTLSKKVIPHFETGEHPLIVAKKLKANPNTVRSYWWRWRARLGI